jgi:hypothetical protein
MYRCDSLKFYVMYTSSGNQMSSHVLSVALQKNIYLCVTPSSQLEVSTRLDDITSQNTEPRGPHISHLYIRYHGNNRCTYLPCSTVLCVSTERFSELTMPIRVTASHNFNGLMDCIDCSFQSVVCTKGCPLNQDRSVVVSIPDT